MSVCKQSLPCALFGRDVRPGKEEGVYVCVHKYGCAVKHKLIKNWLVPY